MFFFLFCHNLFPFTYHWLLQDLWESTSVLWTKFNRFFATPSHWLWFGDLQKHEQHISYEIVMKSIVTWKCWMIISPFCLRLCTPLVAELYTSLWGCWSLLCNRILVIGDILCQRAAMLFKLIVLTMEVIVHWLLPGTIADNLLFAFLLLNLGLKTKRLGKIIRTIFANISTRLSWGICNNDFSSLILFLDKCFEIPILMFNLFTLSHVFFDVLFSSLGPALRLYKNRLGVEMH